MPDPKVALAKDDETPPPPPIKLAADDELPPPKNTYSIGKPKIKQIPLASLSLQGNVFPSSIGNNKAEVIEGTGANDRDFQNTKSTGGINLLAKYFPSNKIKGLAIVGGVGAQDIYNRDIDNSYTNKDPRYFETTPYQKKTELTSKLGGEFNFDNITNKPDNSQTKWNIKGTNIGAGVETVGSNIYPYANEQLRYNANLLNNKNSNISLMADPIDIKLSNNPYNNGISTGIGLSGENKNIGLSGNIFSTCMFIDSSE